MCNSSFLNVSSYKVASRHKLYNALLCQHWRVSLLGVVIFHLSHLSLLPFPTPTAAILESMKSDDEVSETDSDEDNSDLAS